jgi:hypothetical protein
MNKQHNTNQILIQFVLRAQHLARHDTRSDRGYAMLITSVVSISMLSMLAAYMTMTNLSKSSTNAYVDGTNTFYVAESGLNRRANDLRRKFEISNLPTGTNPAEISTCFSRVIGANNTSTYDPNNDFECRNYQFRHGNSSATLKSGNGSTEIANTNDNVNYVAYTFVKPKQNYATTPPTPQRVDSGQPFAGLNALEYKYTVYSTAKKPNSVNVVASTATASEIAAKNKKVAGTAMSALEVTLADSYETKKATADAANATSGANNSSTNIVLEMDFKSRVIPLFQFAAFYEDDLEMDSQMPMIVGGPAHTNGDLLAASYGFQRKYDTGSTYVPNQLKANFQNSDLEFATKLMGKVTVAGSIYDRVTSTQDGWRPDVCTNNNKGSGQNKNCGVMAVYKGSGDKANKDNYFYFPDALEGRTTPLTATEVAVFGQRMEDKSKAIPRLNPPKPGFLREKNYVTNETGLYYGKADIRVKFYPGRTAGIPFDFTSIQNGSGCDRTANKIPIDRQGSTALKCTPLTKGQLRSLQQPVLATTSTTLSTNDLDILKALKVAIASAGGTPLTLNDLNQSIDTTSSALTGWKLTFKNLLSPANQTLLKDKKPTQIATERGSSFLPPPIQFVAGSSIPGTIPNPLPSPAPATIPDLNTNGGFYNKLKSTWMTMLQTNIKSLTYWNRDGIYVEADSNVLTTAYTAASASTLTLGSGLSTNELAFQKKAADTTNSDLAGSFLHQGLAAYDSGTNATEGGLVLHATVSDDTDGDGTDNITAPTPTNELDSVSGKNATGATIYRVDNYRTYPTISGKRKSPYAFVFSGGEELPGPLTISTDQAAYIQGDYNNPNVLPGQIKPDLDYQPSNDNTTSTTYRAYNQAAGTTTTGRNIEGYYRQPAAIIADTITILSNECVNNNGRVGRAGTGTVNCGSSTTDIGSGTKVTNGIAINAGFLSNLMRSGIRNPTTGAYTTIGNNGGLNKYMRLLENWGTSSTGTYYNYTGSMISLGEPLESEELPTGSGVPKRNFNYESRFDTFDKLPPLAPSAVYLQQDVFKRNY